MIELFKNFALTEKSVRLLKQDNQYTFDVDVKLTKPQIKKISQNLFKAEVLSVNTHRPPRKQGYKPSTKRAIIKVKKIDELFPFPFAYEISTPKQKVKETENPSTSPSADKISTTNTRPSANEISTPKQKVKKTENPSTSPSADEINTTEQKVKETENPSTWLFEYEKKQGSTTNRKIRRIKEELKKAKQKAKMKKKKGFGRPNP